MLDEYKEKGELVYHFGAAKARSPSRKEIERARSSTLAASNGGSQLGSDAASQDVNKYLKMISVNDLEMISKGRVGNNSKKMDTKDPVIYGQKGALGKSKPGYSIP